ncbi:MAG: hypothetical protein QOG80_2046 [Pseudonocardiales bacterium]|nr:hypothetical protein [Pseudonocardiales bacterium]
MRLTAFDRAVTGGVDFNLAGRRPPGRWVPSIPVVLESPVHDVWFVLLTIGVFTLLAVIAKGAEKL